MKEKEITSKVWIVYRTGCQGSEESRCNEEPEILLVTTDKKKALEQYDKDRNTLGCYNASTMIEEKEVIE